MKSAVVGVVGLGYVGLPLAVGFAQHMHTIGFDVSEQKVALIRAGQDPTGEVSAAQFDAARCLEATTDPAALAVCDFIVVAVPTPVNDAKLPDFAPLLAACRSVGPHLKAGVTVVFESTVYPGATEDVCVPELERASSKQWKRDFFVGYSPERINPGDKEHTLAKIVKVVAGDTPKTLARVADLYRVVVTADVYLASSIKVAEAAKVIENTQRDLNIALMNELSVIFHRMGIDTSEVLAAAGTKWNFLRFKPGLVGGHCIGVDPYYLTHAAEKLGHHPEVILAGRRINDSMGKYVAEQTVKCMVGKNRPVNGATVNVLGLAFKENCPDLRNSKVADLIAELRSYGVSVQVHDPRVDDGEALREYGIELSSWEALPQADALVLAVAHQEFCSLPLDELLGKVAADGCVIDVKAVLDREAVTNSGRAVWRL
ncbi:MAG TPA: nucleotide sugar dehydrogenase [Usitatibacter sp.]|nr:nucleotide sugar dehydrogenase [Usitatibacter sp.]